MTPQDNARLKQIRRNYAKQIKHEKKLKKHGLDVGKYMGWVPSECEAVFLLRIIEEIERNFGDA